MGFNPTFIKIILLGKEIEDVYGEERIKYYKRLLNCLDLEIKKVDKEIYSAYPEYIKSEPCDHDTINSENKDFRGEKIVSFNAKLTTYEPRCIYYIYMSHTFFDTLPPELFSFKKITSITFNYMKLTSLPSEIGDLSELMYLYLGNNRITTLPTTLQTLPYLSRIELNNNQLHRIPKEIYTFTQINDLNLSENAIEEVDKEIKNLTGLTHLYLDYNQISECDFLLTLPFLEMIDLSHNQLTHIPNLSSLKHVFDIDFSHNQLTSLPEGMTELRCLGYLNLAHNPDLVLTQKEKEWMESLKAYGCTVNDCYRDEL